MAWRTAGTAVAVCLIVSLLSVSPVLAEAPLENPGTAPRVYSGVALLSYYSGTLDLVIEKSPADVEASLDKIPFANIPPSLDGVTAQFRSSTAEVAHEVVYVSEGADRLTALIAQSRLDEAGELSDNLTRVAAQARIALAEMEQATEANGQAFRVDSAPPDSDLRQAYNEVLDRIGRIRQMLALYQDFIDGLLAPNPGTATFISLAIVPGAAFVGDVIAFQGVLTTAGGRSLGGRQVQILLDGLPAAQATTRAGGGFLGSMRVPYRYVKQMTVRAFYNPDGSDIGTYRASLSPDVMLQVLFYEATLVIALRGGAHPGLETQVIATFDYGEWVIASERRVEIYLDNDLAVSLLARPHVRRAVTMPADIRPGRHLITVSAQAMGRYAPVVATADLMVTRVIPTVDLEAPRVAWVLWSAQVSGTVSTDSGPIEGALVGTSLRGAESRTVSAADGAFDARVRMGWGPDLFGTAQVEVNVAPEQPWYGPVTVTRSIYVVNVVNCGALLLALAVLAVYVPRRLKGVLGLWPFGAKLPRQRTAGPEPACSGEAAPAIPAEQAPAEPGGSLRDRVLGWYLLLLAVVQRITRVSPRPNQTLREFMRETGPALGPLSRRFAEATITVEQLLYSRHEPSEQDMEKTRALSQRLEKGLGGEAE